ncbi:MAG: outer membrane lipoprotein chaperone LolA [Spiribacter salinus]|jgi:outer membrane lipoprotein carrier protein|uniref:Outer-membrane lipoprotein carrier protein n=1 Tax=Spiribacter salinus TaxID=1335746 RepID=A0A540VWC2_9GAMM|nr:outer membrane lipoprotein chaperone LolA [Spiribacter sp.]MDR9454912.1 outer membrane lipoprotein chaperone LolA [Spiribacter sp.]TQF01075.1 MAG: outer membrane lipoprotein chaperone LolA [Spiribacter salinus]
MRRFIALCLLLLALPGHADVEQLEAYFEQTDTLVGSFVQTTRDEAGNLVEEAEGAFWIARSQRFRWHYRTPYEQIIVADGERLWVHDVDLEQVVVRPLDDAMGAGAAQLLSGDMANLRDNFQVTAGDDAGQVELQPTDPAWDFQRIQLQMNAGVPVQIVIEDGLGDRIEVQFRELERNASIDEARLRFEPPEGVDVIEGS